MARYFIDSAAVGLNDGSDWTNAFTSVVTAISSTSANDQLIIANTHSEDVSATGSMTFNANCDIISSSVSGASTVTPTKATSAQIYTDTASDDTIYNFNNSTVWGCWFASRRTIRPQNVYSKLCTWQCTYNNSRIGYWYVGASHSVEMMTDDTFYSNHLVQAGISTVDSSKVTLIRPTMLVDGTWDPVDEIFSANNRGSLLVDGGDVSTIPANELLDLSSTATTRISNLKINAATTALVGGTISNNGNEVYIDATDSANGTQHRFAITYYGQSVIDTGIYLDSETPSGLSSSSKMITNTNPVPWLSSLRLRLAMMWVDLSTAKTFTVEIAQDGTTALLNDDDFWVEVVYPEELTAGRQMDSSKGVFDSSTSLATSTASWAGLSGTNSKQKASVTTLNASQAGFVEIYVHLAKPSTTLYVDPKVTIS